jgi:hypothetical protein
MPHRVILRRAPSLLCRHKDWDFGIPGDTLARSACPGQLAVYLTPSALPIYEAQLVVRCMGCGKPIEARGVIPDGVTYWQDDAFGDDDPGDCDDIQPWQG